MEIRIENLLSLEEGLKGVKEKEFKVSTSFKITKNLNKVSQELESYNQEREKIIKKYAQKDKEGEIIFNEDGSISLNDPIAFQRDFTSLLNETVSIDLNFLEIKELENIDISPKVLGCLQPIIKDQS